MTPEPLVVVIDRTPDRRLLPNTGTHPRTQKPYRAVLRAAAAGATQNVLVGRTWAWAGPIVLDVEIGWEDGRGIPDWDNAIAALKGAVDGVFGKLDADDRQVTGIFLVQSKDPRKTGFTRITVTPKEPTP